MPIKMFDKEAAELVGKKEVAGVTEVATALRRAYNIGRRTGVEWGTKEAVRICRDYEEGMGDKGEGGGSLVNRRAGNKSGLGYADFIEKHMNR
jgi:hypothetical protein